MKVKLRVYYHTLQAPGDAHVDEYYAADNFEAELVVAGNSTAGWRYSGALRVHWNYTAPDGKATVRMAKTYAPNEWVTYETLPE